MAAQEWIGSIPPVTRWVLGGCLATTCATTLKIVSPFALYLYFPLVLRAPYEFWRLVTNFLFFSQSFDIGFFFNIYFLFRHSKALEEQYTGRTSDYVFLWFFGAVSLLILDYVLFIIPFTKAYALPFLGPSLSFMIVYVWGKRNPRVIMNLLGLFSFHAPLLPWVLLGFGYILGNNPFHDLCGILVAHVYLYFADTLPATAGIHLLRTPGFMRALFDRRQ
ncbi:Derlin-2.2 protein [Pelomyxa schiedti]|nr:Derlin-2.2 protein [Pelomyxa schiedti]